MSRLKRPEPPTPPPAHEVAALTLSKHWSIAALLGSAVVALLITVPVVWFQKDAPTDVEETCYCVCEETPHDHRRQ